MIERQKNEDGFTIIELLIAMFIGSIMLWVAVSTYVKQDKLLRNENSNVHLRDFARLAMDELVPNIRLAGYGFPSGNSGTGRPARGITVANATTLTYRANTDDVSTLANQDSLASTDNWIWVADPVAAGFIVTDQVVAFDLNTPTNWNPNNSVVNLSTSVLNWGAGQNGFNISPVTNGVPVAVNNYHVITYNYNAGNQIITLADDRGTADGGTDDTMITVANNVSDLTFSYFDANGAPLTTLPLNATDLGNVRKIQISLTMVDDVESSTTATLLTNVHLRNMGT